jgi:hypothetical protein
MAKKPRLYPIIPRVKFGKTKRNTETSNDFERPVLVTRQRQFDRLVKSTGDYTPNVANDVYDQVVGYESRVGLKMPGWRQVIAMGGDASNPYQRIRLIYKATRWTCRSENSGNLSFGHGAEEGSLQLIKKDYGPLVDRATASLKHKLDGNIGKAQLAAPLAESREIHRMLRQINTLGIDTLKALLAIKKTRGKSAFKQFGNIWLGFGFGVNPLLQDVASAANSILDYTTREDRHVRLTGTALLEHQSTNKALMSGNIAWGCFGGQIGSFHHTQGVRIVAGIDLTLRSAASYGVTDHLGLKVGQLPSVLWELTPFSWAVDYFTTVGPWLDDMFYTLPGTTKYVTISYKYLNEGSFYPYTAPNPGFTASIVGKGLVRYSEFERQKLASLPSRSVRIKSSDEVAKHSMTKLLNLSSVLAQKWGPRL